MNQIANTKLVKELATKAGFDFCGIAKAAELTEDALRLEKWLSNGFHGEMQYMEKHFDLRINPKKLVPGAKSVITFLKNYYPDHEQEEGFPKIAKYAWGEDYHEVIKTSLNELLDTLRKKIGPIEGRGFVDSAPVLERTWAWLSGAGWIGKNGNLIRPKQGSFFFIATLIVDLALEYDSPIVKDYCGTCTKCIDACPTQAILPNKTIEANHCISYFTIELKKASIETGNDRGYGDWAFGCDICQDVCPWNRFSKPHQSNPLKSIEGILTLSSSDWISMEENTFKARFKKSPLLRAKLSGLKRNVNYLIAQKEKLTTK